MNSYNRESSYFPFANDYFRLQTDYEQFSRKRRIAFRRIDYRQLWKTVGFSVIFYFLLKKNLAQAKRLKTYYQHDFDRIRFLELLTGVHRIYLEPHSPIYQALSRTITSSSTILDPENLFQCVRTIINELTNFLPENGLLGTHNDESVLNYLLHCSMDQYPPTYFWSIEKHLLLASETQMPSDHFTTKFLLISTFIFRCLIKTLLLKPVKYRLVRGQLNRTQWFNIRLLSTLLLYTSRYAIMYKHGQTHVPMPFPFEMQTYLMNDDKLKQIFYDVDELVESTAPKLSAWACEYAQRLQDNAKRRRRTRR